MTCDNSSDGATRSSWTLSLSVVFSPSDSVP